MTVTGLKAFKFKLMHFQVAQGTQPEVTACLTQFLVHARTAAAPGPGHSLAAGACRARRRAARAGANWRPGRRCAGEAGGAGGRRVTVLSLRLRD